jgi:2-polyprenyl-6-methoxyphenol hydroxylase-like FAD-dependent oxidoreductase
MRRVLVAGAGAVGVLTAMLLARRGYNVQVCGHDFMC